MRITWFKGKQKWQFYASELKALNEAKNIASFMMKLGDKRGEAVVDAINAILEIEPVVSSTEESVD